MPRVGTGRGEGVTEDTQDVLLPGRGAELPLDASPPPQPPDAGSGRTLSGNARLLEAKRNSQPFPQQCGMTHHPRPQRCAATRIMTMFVFGVKWFH